jgi:carboxymethylenebutenolidase
MRTMARRLAAEGYAVLVPNPFYRVSHAPQFATAANLDFGDATLLDRLRPLMASVNAAGHAERDAHAYVAFLDAQREVDRARKLGTQGYCMGGALVVRTAAAEPARIGAGASFHGGGLVTDKPDSPHLLASKIKARMYFGIAASDDQRQPEAKTALKDAFAKAGVPAEIEVYPRATAGAWPTCRSKRARPSTTRPWRSARGATSSRSTGRRWPEHRPRVPHAHQAAGER